MFYGLVFFTVIVMGFGGGGVDGGGGVRSGFFLIWIRGSRVVTRVGGYFWEAVGIEFLVYRCYVVRCCRLLGWRGLDVGGRIKGLGVLGFGAGEGGE